MKGTIKKILAFFMTAVIAVCALSVTASAATLAERAKTAKSGKSYSSIMKPNGSAVYKVNLKKDGILKFNITHDASRMDIAIYDSNGNILNTCDDIKDMSITKGRIERGNIYKEYVKLLWGSAFQKFEGSFGYELKKGTYYVELWRPNFNESGKGNYTFKATYPSGSASSDSSVKFSNLTIKMDKGDTLKLGMDTNPSNANIKWSSSKESVAAVSSSGKVTAKKAGTAILTAASGKTSMKIKVIVE